ncbi:hypothetical protein SAMN04489712_13843 [Thermomonospora echinospora]|uniref:Uncharacterized protein n=1 Tax=Thermomonospora echinospora TaxID=1992 RepID=A0A1H6E6G8_9ACTN|nr:hypothetical protein [Thermomonospora echinospora]SEG93398.1 hypothetical protein SAMN04489712_13843 [Thermomonospora echinospora]
MANWRDKITVAPPWAYFLLTCAFCGPSFGVLMWLLMPQADAWSALAGGVAFGVGFPAFITSSVVRERRRLRETAGDLSRQDLLALARAVRVGEPPADPALDRPLLAMLERRRTQLESAARSNPWIFGALAAVGLLRAFTEGEPRVYAGTAVLLVLLIVSLKLLSMRRTRLERLEQQISAREERPATQPEG